MLSMTLQRNRHELRCRGSAWFSIESNGIERRRNDKLRHRIAVISDGLAQLNCGGKGMKGKGDAKSERCGIGTAR